MTIVTTATEKLLTLRKRIRAISGGTGASKTFSIVMILVDYSQSVKGEKVDIVSESFPHLEAGVIQDFKTIMKDRNYWKDKLWNETKHIYNFETRTTVKFMSVDKIGKAHGPRRDVLFLNECNFIPYEIVDQLITRTRKVVWMDWNPSEDFWFYEKILGKRDDVEFLGENGDYPPLTFLDNEALTESEKIEIEAHKNDANWYKVYGLGQRGEIEGRIYTNWQFIDEIPHEARLEGYGLDFGYDIDPSALVAVYYYNGGYIFDELLYARKFDNIMLAQTLRNLPQGLVVADSAEPKSIKEIKDFGINIVGAKKGPDSVRYGVKVVQSQKCSATKRSVNLIKEFRNYLQSYSKDGVPIMGKYEGECHLLDALRYKFCSLIPIQRRREYIESLPRIPRMANRRTNIAV